MKSTCLWALLLTGCLFWLAPGQSLLAQTAPKSASLLCGTPSLTPAQAMSMVVQGKLALQRKRAARQASTGIAYVPIRPHIFRYSNGTGGLSMGELNRAMAATNSYYLINGMGIQFYFAGTTPDYIDDDQLYPTFPDADVPSLASRDAFNAMNQYYVYSFANPTIGGFASFPANHVFSTRSFVTGDGDRVMPHELGHNFNLMHTFGQGGVGNPLPTTELVTRGSGANCTTDGDLICDTPADPNYTPGASLINVNGCPAYNPNSAARDANGDAYNPSITNIMSYYFPCTHDFTVGQLERAQEGLALRQTHTAYTLDAPATDMASPSNLTIQLAGTRITLTWQDNASNEMGYFIERSTSPTTGFLPIGGVGPDETTFTDYDVRLRNHYYYRVRPSNTTTGSLSSTVDVATPASTSPVSGLATTSITAGSAQLNWSSLGANLTYDVQWRPTGSPAWNTLSRLEQTSTSLTYLTSSTSYQWQVKASDVESYSGPVEFTTQCATPQIYPFQISPDRTTAAISWYANSLISTLQWRMTGVANWNTISNITIPSAYTLTGLSPGTNYEVRLQGVCSSTATSDFTATLSFTTYTCPPPTGLSTSTTKDSTLLYWSIPYPEPGQLFEIRYRPQGATSWTTVSNINTTGYKLGGLTSTTYEWQVKRICSPTELSDYSSLSNFSNTCATALATGSMVASTTASLFWVTYSPSTEKTSEVQYRPVGTIDWTTVSFNNTISNYTIRLLTGLIPNTNYEWRLRSVCSATAQSVYLTNTFTTSCYAPSYLYVNLVTTSSASLSWSTSFEAGTKYDLRYRPVGDASWATISNLSSGTATGLTYSLTGLTNSTSYEWQVRTVCSATESSTFAAGPTFTTQCQPPNYLNQTVLVTSAQLYWNQAGIDLSYEVRYRPVNTTTWTTVNNLTSTSIAVSGLTTSTNYEWQVRTQCTGGVYSDFSGSSIFTTISCYAPTSLYLNTVTTTTTSAELRWSFQYADAGTRYEGRYRTIGAANWITLSNLTSTNGVGSFTLTGLASNTQYEWQLKTLCSPTESSDFTIFPAFQTLSTCSLPGNLTTTNITGTSAQINWTFPAADVNTRYEGRYRSSGDQNWIPLPNLTSTNGVGSFVLTGLTSNVLYFWEIKTICSATEYSQFSLSNSFQSTSPCSSMYTIKVGTWSDPSVWSCGRVPLSSDPVQIKHLVVVPANYQANVMRINFDNEQKLIFGLGSTVKFGQ